MHTWKSHLVAALRRLAHTRADAQLGQVRPLLASVLDADALTFHAADGTPLPDETSLGTLLEQPFSARLELACTLHRTPRVAPAPPPDAVSRFHVGDTPPAQPADHVDLRFAQFVEEFLRLGRSREFMWAGYVVHELMPRVGYPPHEAKLVLDRLRSEGIISITKVKNPQNPGFPATGVQLNREHPRVKAVLNDLYAEVDDEEPAPTR